MKGVNRIFMTRIIGYPSPNVIVFEQNELIFSQWVRRRIQTLDRDWVSPEVDPNEVIAACHKTFVDTELA